MYFYKILLFKVNFAKKYGVMNKQNAVFLFILVISLDPPQKVRRMGTACSKAGAICLLGFLFKRDLTVFCRNGDPIAGNELSVQHPKGKHVFDL